jgi:DNA-binding GntR family transcriptional regulator
MTIRTDSDGFAAFRRGENLPDAIANAVAQAIAAGTLPMNTRIVETDLAARLNVSRVPVREGLKILHTQGIITNAPRGYRVAALSDRRIASVQEVRIALETLFLRDAIAAWREGRADIADLDRPINAMRRAARVDDVEEILRADIAFHTEICEAAQNPLYLALWKAIARHVLIVLNLARFRDIEIDVVVRRHEALRHQIAAAVKADAGMDAIRDILARHFLAERRPGRPQRAKSPRVSRSPPSGTNRS